MNASMVVSMFSKLMMYAVSKHRHSCKSQIIEWIALNTHQSNTLVLIIPHIGRKAVGEDVRTLCSRVPEAVGVLYEMRRSIRRGISSVLHDNT